MGASNRLMSLSGLAAVAMLLSAAVLFDFYEYLPEPGEIQAHLDDNATRVQIAGYVGMVAAFFLFWFASVLRSRLRSAETGDGMVANVTFAGLVGAAGLSIVAFSVMLASGARAGSDSGISDATAALSYDTYGLLVGSGMAIALGVAIAAFAVVSARTRLMPAWFNWVSLLIALGSISPLSYIFIALAVAWVAYVSVALWWADRDIDEPAMGV